MPIDRRNFLTIAATGVVQAARRATKPHLILFLADDLGCWDTSVFGNRTVRTPNVERLAASGTTFANCFSGAAICIPSRAILASGLCSHRNGAIANGRQLRADIRTLPTYLKDLGYKTAHFGKNHYLPKESYADWEAVPSEIRREALTSDLNPQAVDQWLADRSASKQPLCLIVNCHSPHVTWDENRDYDPARVSLPPSFADTPETRAARCRYYTDVTKMDEQLGQVYASVRKHLGGDALFLFTSDNGAQWPFAKWNLYDAGIRLPLIASWPGVIKAGAANDAMLHFTDFLPSFMEAAGGRPPSDIDGKSFLGVLTGSAKTHRKEIFASHTADNNGQMNCYPMRAVRDGRYKYIRNLRPDLAYHTHIDRGVARDGREYWESWRSLAKTDPGTASLVRRYHQRPAEELYDLREDPHELRNAATQASSKTVLDRMRASLDRWMKGMNDEGELFGPPRPLDQNPKLFEGLAT
ncbi:MAG: sulfatase [Bryobacterales bacterium]|nr:sulfatase [Bryobacterales bacterium]